MDGAKVLSQIWNPKVNLKQKCQIMTKILIKLFYWGIVNFIEVLSIAYPSNLSGSKQEKI